jgi:hypothetical protein
MTDDPTPPVDDTPADEPQDFAAFEAAQNEPEEKRSDDDKPAPEVNDADATPADEEPPKDEKRGRSAEARINTLTAKLRQAERERDEARFGKPVPQESGSELKAPDPFAKNADGTDKYEFGQADPDYLADLTDYKVEAKLAERDKKTQALGERGAVQAQLEDGMANIEAKGTEKYTDFEEKITAAVEARGGEPLHPVVSVGLAVSPVGADVAYKLATDTAASDRLEHLASTDMQAAAMAFGELEGEFTDNDDDLKIKDPLDMARMLGRMRARQGKPAATVTQIKTTNAPEPPKERARGGGGTFQADSATTDFPAFERMANRK